MIDAQDIFNRAETLADDLHVAQGCHRAMIQMLEPILSREPDHGHSILALLQAADHFTGRAEATTREIALKMAG